MAEIFSPGDIVQIDGLKGVIINVKPDSTGLDDFVTIVIVDIEIKIETMASFCIAVKKFNN